MTGALAVVISACGSGGVAIKSGSQTSKPFVQVSSSYCPISTSASSRPGAKASEPKAGPCTFVFSDGRRFSCPARFGRGPAVVGVIEHATVCKPLTRLAISAALRAVGARIERVRACLIAHGLQAFGGVVLPPQNHGGPAGELDTAGTLGGLIAFYTDRRQANRAVAAIIGNVNRFGGRFERANGANIAWLRPPPNALRDTVHACAVL